MLCPFFNMRYLLLLCLVLIPTLSFSYTQTPDQPSGDYTLAVGRGSCGYKTEPGNASVYLDKTTHGQSVWFVDPAGTYAWHFQQEAWCGVGSKYAVEQWYVVLAPAQPDHCTDELISGDELGYDCGGSCSSVCVATCRPGTDMYTDVSGNTSCITEVPADNYGNCPNLVDWYYYPASETEAAFCSSVEDAWMSDAPVTLPAVQDPWTKETTSTTSYSVGVVDNGDGTSTKTETTSIVNPDGGTVQDSTSSIIDNSTGDVISSSTNNTTVINNPDSAWSEDTKKIVEAINKLTDASTPQDLTEDVEGTEASILAAVDTATTDGVNASGDLIDSELTAIQQEYADNPDTWITSESITSKTQLILPASQACSDVIYTLSNGHDVTISCNAMQKIKDLLSIVLSILTLLYIYDIVFRQDIVKG